MRDLPSDYDITVHVNFQTNARTYTLWHETEGELVTFDATLPDAEIDAIISRAIAERK